MAAARASSGRRRLRWTALLLAAAAVAGVLRQLWSSLWRERAGAATSQMRERAELAGPAPAPDSHVTASAPVPVRRGIDAQPRPVPEQRAVIPVADRPVSLADFETPADGAPRGEEADDPPAVVEIRR